MPSSPKPRSGAMFASKLGLIATTVGSAVGLGNVWRFPAQAQEGGGAAFLFLYIACVFLLGIPVMLAEFSIGRQGRSDALGVFRNVSPGTHWWITGLVAIITCYLIMAFYMVVEGWTAEYLWNSITGELYRDIEGADPDTLQSRMRGYIQGPWAPLVATWAVCLINYLVLIGGVKKGIERMSNIMMPLLFFILIALMFICLSLPGAGAGIDFFLKPDFSKITIDVVVGALGQTFFSLSLGMGILITYSGYYPDDTHLTRTSTIVACMSVLVGLMMGFIIFPAVTSFGLAGESLQGTTLVFVTLPEVFAQMPATWVWSVMFFLLLLTAALTSTMSGLEVAVRFLQDRTNMSRKKACFWATAPLTVLSTLCCLSFGPLSGFTLSGKNLFGFLELLTTDYCLPLTAIVICLYVGWFAPRGLLRDQLSNHSTLPGHGIGLVRVILRYFAPLCILAILLSKIL